MTQPRSPFSAETLNVIAEVRRLLEYHLGSGIETYPRTEEIKALQELRATVSPKRRAALKDVEVQPRTPARSAPAPDGSAGPVRTSLPLSSLLEIRGEVEGCRACALAEQRIRAVAGEGSDSARLMVVGDWLGVAAEQQIPDGCLFGVEQDRMLGKMLEAINLARQEVFITNVIKCGIPADCQPRAEHVHACLSYLHRQLAALRPAAILCMGMIAARTLLNRREPLSRLRGKIHSFAMSGTQPVPLIATYHPTFLLQNPEMKKATWLDLQLLARQLGQPPA